MADEPHPAKPSASTVGSAVGGMAATLLLLVLAHFKVTVDPIAAASIGGGMAALVGYFFSGGKSADTE